MRVHVAAANGTHRMLTGPGTNPPSLVCHRPAQYESVTCYITHQISCSEQCMHAATQTRWHTAPHGVAFNTAVKTDSNECWERFS